MYNEEVKKVLLRIPVSLLEQIDDKVGVYPYCTRTDAMQYLLKEGLIYQEKKREIKKLLNRG